MVLQKRDGFAGGRGENKTMQVRVCAWVCGDPGSGEHPGFTAGFQLVSFLISFPFLKIFFLKEEERTQRSERCHGPQAGRGCDKDPPGSRCCCPDFRHPQTSPLAFGSRSVFPEVESDVVGESGRGLCSKLYCCSPPDLWRISPLSSGFLCRSEQIPSMLVCCRCCLSQPELSFGKVCAQDNRSTE